MHDFVTERFDDGAGSAKVYFGKSVQIKIRDEFQTDLEYLRVFSASLAVAGRTHKKDPILLGCGYLEFGERKDWSELVL